MFKWLSTRWSCWPWPSAATVKLDVRSYTSSGRSRDRVSGVGDDVRPRCSIGAPGRSCNQALWSSFDMHRRCPPRTVVTSTWEPVTCGATASLMGLHLSQVCSTRVLKSCSCTV